MGCGSWPSSRAEDRPRSEVSARSNGQSLVTAARQKIEAKVETLAVLVLPGGTDLDPGLGIIGVTNQYNVM